MKISVIIYGNLVEEIEKTILNIKKDNGSKDSEIIIMNYDERDEEIEK